MIHSSRRKTLATWRVAAVAVTSAALVASLAACVQTPSSTTSGSSPAATGKYTIYMVPGITTDPGYTTMQCGGEAEAKKLGVKLEYTGSTAFDPTQQIPIVQSLLAKKPSALLLTPTDGTALIPVVKQYVAAKIPVIALDTTLTTPSLLTAAITSSGIQGGKAAADSLGSSLNGKGTVALMSGNAGASTDNDRVKGFQDEMASKYPGITVLGVQYSKDSITTAAAQAQAIMLAHSDLGGIFAVDGNTATGAANAVDGAGKKGKIIVAGYDAEPAAVKLLQSGSLEVLVIQDFAKEGALGVKYAVDKLEGKTGSIVKSTALSNIIATHANMADPSVTKYFYSATCSN